MHEKGIELNVSFGTINQILQNPLGKWLIVVCVLALMGSFVGLVTSWLGDGTRGLLNFTGVLGRGLGDLVLVSPQRILALATLTARESIRRKALWVGAVFVVLFMFAGWFIGEGSDIAPAKNYISFVMTTTRWMLLPVAVMLACWGLPADIRDRSLHTVVTKPVRRSEVVLGRITGYIFVMSTLLLVVGVVGYLWVLRVVPERSQRQLIARVPHYGGLKMLNGEGEAVNKDGTPYTGINVGDYIELKRFIEGATKQRAIWIFKDLRAAEFPGTDDVRLEYNFEAFRTYKGEVDSQIAFQVNLVNPKTKLRVPINAYPVNEFSSEVVHVLNEAKPENLISLHRQIEYTEHGAKHTADLFQDLVDGGELTVELACIDAHQFLGVSPEGLFVRLPDRSFFVGYWKAMFVTWMMLVVIVTIGTTSSCILKGPVATLATSGLLVLGTFLKGSLLDRLNGYYNQGGVMGGGSVEAFYRIMTRMNEQSPLDDSLTKKVIETLDSGVYAMLYLAQYVIPDMRAFDAAHFIANGFDVSWLGCLLPSVLITLGFFIPAYIIGYFGLQVRELEAK